MSDLNNEVAVETVVNDKVLETTIVNPIQIVREIIETDRDDVVFDGINIVGDGEKIAEFMASYAKFFNDVENPKNTKQNDFLKNKYSPLDVVLNCVRVPMSKQGLSFIQMPVTDDSMIKVNTLLMHKNGCYMSIEGVSIKPDKNTAQGIGGIITYIKRYMINAICGISSEGEDDDGNTASGKVKKETKAMTSEELSKLNLTTLKAKTTTLAKDKMKTIDKKVITDEIETQLGKGITVGKSVDKDKDNLIKLYLSLQEM